MEKRFGLIGRSVGHSLSKAYFDEKFFREGLTDLRYDLYPLESIELLPDLLEKNKKLCGLNVTLPYKESVIPYLSSLDKTAKKIGAVNVIKIKGGKLVGYNTDGIAFGETLERWLPKKKDWLALVLGTGGVSKAIQYYLDKMGIKFQLLSRQKQPSEIVSCYEAIKENKLLDNHKLIINCTPVGMFPHSESFPPLPYEQLDNSHFLYDLIYNPARTVFLQKGEMRGASVKNGIEMLHIQAEKAWEIWND